LEATQVKEFQEAQEPQVVQVAQEQDKHLQDQSKYHKRRWNQSTD